MKNILYITLASFIFLLGCKKNLDPEIYGTINSVSFPKTENDYILYTMEVYKTFVSKWEYFPMGEDGDVYHMWFPLEYYQQFDYGCDIMPVYTLWGGGFEQSSSSNYEPSINASEAGSPFNKTKEVTRITKIIYDIENSDINMDTKNMLMGEAKMARGWTMYLLLHLYGPVPVILDPNLVSDYDALSDMTRPERSYIVNAIAEDLRFAADNLPKEMPDYGRFNKGLALTQLMRLYMNEKDFSNAESVGREIQDMGYALVDDYKSIFEEATERNTETIYAISCNGASDGRGPDASFNPFNMYFLPSDFPTEPTPWGNPAPFSATWEFYNSFAENDARRETLISSYESSDGVVHDSTSLPGAIINKYPKSGTETTYMGNDLVIARYADVILMLAEAINENNNGPNQEAIDLVNEVRSRSGISDLPDEDIASKDAFNDAILRERGWELYFEGVRKFDLERHGKWPEMVNAVPGKLAGPYLLPIPQYAISASEGQLTQNEGYN